MDDEELTAVRNKIDKRQEYLRLYPEKMEKLLKVDYWFKEARRKINGIIQNCINCD